MFDLFINSLFNSSKKFDAALLKNSKIIGPITLILEFKDAESLEALV